MSEASLYVYGVMRADDAPSLGFKAVSAPGEAPQRVVSGAVQAIVSPIELDEVMPARRNLLAHAKGLEIMMEAGPVLPMRFGLIAATEEMVAATLAANEKELLERLDELTNKAEFGVRVAWTREALMREVVNRYPDLRRAYDALAGKSEVATHYERVELGRRVESAMHDFKHEEAVRCATAIEAIAERTVSQDPDDDLTALKMDCLVTLARADELAAALEELQAGRDADFDIKLVGPSPAYNFTKLSLDWAAAAEAA